MAKDETRRLQPSIVQEDRDTLAAVANIANYQPNNPAWALDKLQAALTEMTQGQVDERQQRAAAAAARDDAVAQEWAFHNLMLNAKDQVIAQYGRDSNEAQSVGLKKKSERKSPTRKSPPP
jgi:hypothetical protein